MAARSRDVMYLSGGDLVPKLNDGIDGSLPTKSIDAAGADMEPWIRAAAKTQENQREFMTHVGDEARKTDVVVRQAPVFITADDEEGGCGLLQQEGKDGTTSTTKLVPSSSKLFDAKATAAMGNVVMMVKKPDGLFQCVPHSDDEDVEEEKKARQLRAWKYLARMAQIENMKKDADNNTSVTQAQSEEMMKTITTLQRDAKVKEYLYSETLPMDEIVKGIAKKLAKLARQYPSAMSSLRDMDVATAFARKMYTCAQKTKEEPCTAGECGWLPFTDNVTGQTSGVCFPGMAKGDGTFSAGEDNEDALIRPDNGAAAKSVGELVKNTKRPSAAEVAAFNFWKTENAKLRRANAEAERRVYQRLQSGIGSPSARSQRSQLTMTLGGGGGGDGSGAAPSVFSTAGSDASSAWSAGSMRVF